MTEETPEALAGRVGAAMLAKDRAARALGIGLDAIGPGYARCTLTVRDEMLNGHDILHGGVLFTLADTTFAFACNAANKLSVALDCSINFAAPGRLGDRLVAECRERTRSGRTGIYDVTVSTDAGAILAVFRGTSYQLKSTVVDV